MTGRLAALLLPLLVAAGCAAPPERPVAETSGAPFAADCTALTQPPGGAGGVKPSPAASTAPTVVLPDLELPCLTGSAAVSLRALRGPAVINLWASWCGPCRTELPAFQRLAERAGGELHVVGVDTRDRDAGARSLAADLGLTFPTLTDPDERLRIAVERAALPVTLFVDPSGHIRHIHDSTALDDRALTELVRRHLGVLVTP